jgi:hypothetical protein
MHDFLDTPVRDAIADPIAQSAGRVLDADLDTNWIGAAAVHLRRRGFTIREARDYIGIHAPHFRTIRRSYLRKVLVGREENPRLLLAIKALPNRSRKIKRIAA